jgi:hypothetical protein
MSSIEQSGMVLLLFPTSKPDNDTFHVDPNIVDTLYTMIRL